MVPVPVVQCLALQSAGYRPSPGGIRDKEGGSLLLTDIAYHGLYRGALAVKDYGGALLDNPSLLPGDLFQSVPQYGGVFQGDVGDYRRVRRRDDIGGIQPSPQSTSSTTTWQARR